MFVLLYKQFFLCFKSSCTFLLLFHLAIIFSAWLEKNLKAINTYLLLLLFYLYFFVSAPFPNGPMLRRSAGPLVRWSIIKECLRNSVNKLFLQNERQKMKDRQLLKQLLLYLRRFGLLAWILLGVQFHSGCLEGAAITGTLFTSPVPSKMAHDLQKTSEKTIFFARWQSGDNFQIRGNLSMACVSLKFFNRA